MEIIYGKKMRCYNGNWVLREQLNIMFSSVTKNMLKEDKVEIIDMLLSDDLMDRAKIMFNFLKDGDE